MKALWFVFMVFAKIVGKVAVFACVPFRAYARSVVYNGCLQGICQPPKRLMERQPERTPMGWVLKNIHGLADDQWGFIAFRNVSKLEFYLVVFFIWGWLDDDSNQDTTDTGYLREVITGYRWKAGVQTDEKVYRWHAIFRPWLKKIDLDSIVYGNAFDLGDNRAKNPFYNWIATLVWNDRNTAMNFQYLWGNY